MRAAAIDLGAVRVGVAVADELGMLAHPRPPLSGRDPGRLVEALNELAVAEGIDIFVVGLPRRLDGKEGREARAARLIAARLAERTRCRVELVDERFSTHEAERRLTEQGLAGRERRARIDSASAAVLLQSWLDSRSLGSQSGA
jgi:putative Holliday junction resolvase